MLKILKTNFLCITPKKHLLTFYADYSARIIKHEFRLVEQVKFTAFLFYYTHDKVKKYIRELRQNEKMLQSFVELAICTITALFFRQNNKRPHRLSPMRSLIQRLKLFVFLGFFFSKLFSFTAFKLCLFFFKAFCLSFSLCLFCDCNIFLCNVILSGNLIKVREILLLG